MKRIAVLLLTLAGCYPGPTDPPPAPAAPDAWNATRGCLAGEPFECWSASYLLRPEADRIIAAGSYPEGDDALVVQACAIVELTMLAMLLEQGPVDPESVDRMLLARCRAEPATPADEYLCALDGPRTRRAVLDAIYAGPAR